MHSVALVPSSSQSWEQQWSYLLSNFAPTSIYVLGAVERKVRPFADYVSVKTAEELPSPLVLMAPMNGKYYPGSIALPDFEHPENACYLFGSDNVTLSTDHMGNREPDHCVYVPTSTKDDMYSFIAGAVTFYDKAMKRG